MGEYILVKKNSTTKYTLSISLNDQMFRLYFSSLPRELKKIQSLEISANNNSLNKIPDFNFCITRSLLDISNSSDFYLIFSNLTDKCKNLKEKFYNETFLSNNQLINDRSICSISAIDRRKKKLREMLNHIENMIKILHNITEDQNNSIIIDEKLRKEIENITYYKEIILVPSFLSACYKPLDQYLLENKIITSEKENLIINIIFDGFVDFYRYIKLTDFSLSSKCFSFASRISNVFFMNKKQSITNQNKLEYFKGDLFLILYFKFLNNYINDLDLDYSSKNQFYKIFLKSFVHIKREILEVEINKNWFLTHNEYLPLENILKSKSMNDFMFEVTKRIIMFNPENTLVEIPPKLLEFFKWVTPEFISRPISLLSGKVLNATVSAINDSK